MLAWIFIVLFLLILAMIPVVGTYQIFRDILKYFFSDWYNRNLFFTKVDPVRKDFLAKNFKYYNALSHRDRITFERRVQKFVGMKNFESREGLNVTMEMETLVAAAAIQVTFGYPSVYLEHFDRIILYPEAYYSTINEVYHQGEVNSRGIIVLSWRNLVEGYLQPGDGRNLALHEMAHALKISDIQAGRGYDFLDREVLHTFIRHAREEMHLMANGESSFFRQYAATNDHEFFAVAIENFFEKPEAFRNFHSPMYDSLAELMNQNPLKMNSTYGGVGENT
jgi:MtfA peptidase